MKTLTIFADLPESRSRIYVLLTDFVVGTLVSFKKPFVYCESGFGKPLCKATGGFQLVGHD